MSQEVVNKSRNENKNFTQKLSEFLELFTRLFNTFNSKKEMFDVIICSPESEYGDKIKKLNKILCDFLNTYPYEETIKDEFYILNECMEQFFESGSILFNKLLNSLENNKEEDYINALIEELYSFVSNIKKDNEDNDFEDNTDYVTVVKNIDSLKKMKDLEICDLNTKVRIIINITSIKIKESEIVPILVFVSYLLRFIYENSEDVKKKFDNLTKILTNLNNN